MSQKEKTGESLKKSLLDKINNQINLIAKSKNIDKKLVFDWVAKKMKYKEDFKLSKQSVEDLGVIYLKLQYEYKI